MRRSYFLTLVPCTPVAQALNKQGNLNEIFGVNSTGGVIAPRNCKAYASKRLQQVVDDFREQRRRESE
jgi:DNA excision repair protein ERCC-5